MSNKTIKILVTGGAGYIGSHVCKKLASLGYYPIVADNLSKGHRDFVRWGEFVNCDLNDISQIYSIFNQHEISAVMHFASSAYVGESVANPQLYYCNNVRNSLNLLQVILDSSVRHVIFSSSCATYGIPKSLPIVEDQPQIPINPYGNSKLFIERILEDYGLAYGLRYIILRYFNAAGADPDAEIGERHSPETHIIPITLDVGMGVRDYVEIFGDDYPTPDGTCIRDYIHVCDLADAHVKALEYLLDGGGSDHFNLGNGTGFSVNDVIAECERVTGRKIMTKTVGRRAGDPPVLVSSSNKAKRVLGWQSQYTDLKSIVDTAWRWHVADSSAKKI